MSDLLLEPISQPFKATFTPPGSKSLTNRALVMAVLADGVCDLSNVLFADDTLVMIESLGRLGFHLEVDRANHAIRVHGRGGRIDKTSAELFCGNSGTTIRFLTALCALGEGAFTLDGIARMRQRPIGALTGMLKNLGVRTSHSPEAEGFPPVHVHAHGLPGGRVRYGAEMSSQYLSAVLMIAPYARHEVIVDLDPNQTSWPYIAMTMQLMDHFGVTPELVRDPETNEPKQIYIPQGKYAATNYLIEPDASNASYFLAAAVINPGSSISIDQLGKQSLQGDVAFADVLHRMGADLIFGRDFVTIKAPEKLEAIRIDMNKMPDVAMTLAVVALFAEGTTRIDGLHTLRVKETDRITALATELRKLGATVQADDQSLTITPPKSITPAQIDTYDDHRMAMSFAIAGTRAAGVTIRDIECVNKTYPQFFEDFQRVGSST